MGAVLAALELVGVSEHQIHDLVGFVEDLHFGADGQYLVSPDYSDFADKRVVNHFFGLRVGDRDHDLSHRHRV